MNGDGEERLLYLKSNQVPETTGGAGEGGKKQGSLEKLQRSDLFFVERTGLTVGVAQGKMRRGAEQRINYYKSLKEQGSKAYQSETK